MGETYKAVCYFVEEKERYFTGWRTVKRFRGSDEAKDYAKGYRKNFPDAKVRIRRGKCVVGYGEY